MVYGIFSDIHANVEALERVLKRLQKEGVTQYICLGDAVEAFLVRASTNVACLERLRDFKGVLLLGNHDALVLKERRLPSELRAVLSRARLTYESDDGSVLAAHALYTQPKEFWGAYSEPDYADELSEVCHFHPSVRLLALGHEHTPLLMQRRSRGIFASFKTLLEGHFEGEQRFTVESDCTYLAVVGPVLRGYGLVYHPDKKELLFFRE